MPPGIGELYYTRILLTVQKGCMGYRCIKTTNGHTYDTFQEACSALGLLDDDREFIDGITENGELGSGHQLRWLFVHLLTTSTMTSPDIVWAATWQLLSNGILFELRKHLNNSGNVHCTYYEIYAPFLFCLRSNFCIFFSG
jgi:hypothetical protein